MKHILKVADMGCNHCRIAIENRLKELAGVTEFSINLENQTVELETDLDLTFVLEVMDEIGYPAEKIE